MMKITFQRRTAFENDGSFDGVRLPVAIISALDPDARPIAFPAGIEILDYLPMAFHDITTPCEGLVLPTRAHALDIAEFIRRCQRHDWPMIALCEAGVGRSAAIAAAAARMVGTTHASVRQQVLSLGTYNRLLYKLLLDVAMIPRPPEPSVSIAVRVKYSPDRLLAFMLSMQRQRWTNWQCVAVTDGPNPAVVSMAKMLDEPRLTVIETPERKGRWGHPWRQVGIDACTGDYIGLQNDDNYLTPGFLEQAMMALEASHADLCLINMLHNYFSYRACVVEVGSADVGSWIAKAELVKATPWTGDDFVSDNDYVRALANKASQITNVQNFLFVHN